MENKCMKRKITTKNFEKVLDNLKQYYQDNVKGSGATEKAFLTDFNVFLDELVSQDVFGTEGQCDPRGDQRD